MNYDAVRRLMENDRFAAHSGVKVLEISEGYAKVSLEVESRHCNGVGVVQGGAIFTLADLAFAAAVNSHGNVAVAINVSISFLKGTSSGTLFAEAREISKSARLASCSVDVTDQTGALVAVFQGMAYRKKDLVTDMLQGKKEE
jgi:acyl-CoA thioesterase